METTLLFKTTLILTFELGIAFGLCIYLLKAAKRAALAEKPFFGVYFRLAVNMKNEIDLIPDATRVIEYPRTMEKQVIKPKEEWKNPRKQETEVVFVNAENREEAIAYLKDGFYDSLFIPKIIQESFGLWLLSSIALFIASISPPHENYLLLGMSLFTFSNLCLGPLLAWIMLMMDENDGIRALKITIIVTFLAGFIGYSDFYSFAQNGYLILLMFLLLTGLIILSLVNIIRGFSRGTSRLIAIGGAALFALFIIVDFNRLVYLEDLNINDWDTAFYMSYTLYLDIINLLLQILDAMSNS